MYLQLMVNMMRQNIQIIDGICYIPMIYNDTIYIYIYLNGKHVLCLFDGEYI